MESIIIYNYLQPINIEAGEETFNRAFKKSTIMRSEVMPGASDNYMTLKAPKKGDILIKKAAVIPLLPSLPLNWGNGTNKGLIQEKQICGWRQIAHS